MSPENPAQPPPSTRWLVLSVTAPPPGEEIHLAEALRRVGARALHRRGGRVLAYIPDPPPLEEVLQQTRGSIRTATSLSDPELQWEWRSQAEMEQEWIRPDAPLRAGSRTVIATPDQEVEPDGDNLVIRLHPGAAFGDGSHPTTRSSLRMLERLVRPGDRVADVGTGSGVLAIAAARLGAGTVLAFEVDRMAVREAERNIRLNQVGDRVRLQRLEVSPGDLVPMGPFQGIFANLEPGIVLPLADELRGALANAEGWLVVSGVPRGERAAVVQVLLRHRFRLDLEEVRQGWWTGVFRAGQGDPGGTEKGPMC